MSYVYTRKGKIVACIIIIWFVTSFVVALSGMLLLQTHLQTFPINNNQVTIDYYIVIGGLISLMFGAMIVGYGFNGFGSCLDWCEWKEKKVSEKE